jgi:hypothetical protein
MIGPDPEDDVMDDYETDESYAREQFEPDEPAEDMG